MGDTVQGDKVKRIIEYQKKRQRTPSECVDFLRDKVARGQIGRLITIYVDPKDTFIGFVAGNEERNYTRSKMNWDVDNWKMMMFTTLDTSEKED